MINRMSRLVVVLSSVPVAAVAAQAMTAIRSRTDLDLFTETYYMKPRPDLVRSAIAFIGTASVPNDAARPMIVFFSEVFRANPESTVAWTASIEQQGGLAKGIFRSAMALGHRGGILKFDDERTPGMNDAYWGGFFASGDTAFVSKLIEHVAFFNDRSDIQLFVTGASAMWSLASNARLHPRVRQSLGSAKAQRDRATAALVDELLARGPEGMKARTSEIIKQQRAAGVWK